MSYSESIEDYLKALSKLGAGSRPVAVADLAQQLGVSPVSAHEMIRRLGVQGLVIYQPYHGILLTPAGAEIAAGVLQRHRLWERFLHDMLGLSWAQVHEEAGRLEHVTSPAVTEKLAGFLDYPESCPHGYPISGVSAEAGADAQECPLNALVSGERASIVRVPEDDIRLLAYVEELGLYPQTEIEVLHVAPFEGPITLRIGSRQQVIGHKLAAQITVRRHTTHTTDEEKRAA